MAMTAGRVVSGGFVCAVATFAVYAGCARLGNDGQAPPSAPTGSATQNAAPREERDRAHADAVAPTDAFAAPTPDTDVATPRHALTGSVRTADGRALGNAIVRAEPVPILPGLRDTREAVEVTADASGAFEVQELAAGDWAFCVSAEGALRTYVATVRVPDRGRVDLVLPRGSVIVGTVIDETTNAPVADARVRLEGYNRWIGDTRTSYDGRFQIALYDSLAYHTPFQIRATGYALTPAESSALSIDENLHGRHEVTLVATRGHTLTGSVVGPDGPVARAHVEVWAQRDPDAPEHHRVAKTDDRGQFAIEHLQIDRSWSTFLVAVEAPGLVQENAPDPDIAPLGPPYGKRFDPEDDGWIVPEIRMRRRAPLGRCTIEGHVLDYDEKPVAGVTVTTRQGSLSVSTTSRADGSFVLADVPTEQAEGAVEIVGTFDGSEIGSESIETVPGERVDDAQVFVDVPDPSPPPHARGRVTDAQGEPVSGARVVVVSFRVEAMLIWGGGPDQAPGVETRTADDGSFDVAFADDHHVAVAVEAPGYATWSRDFAIEQLPEPLEIVLAVSRAVAGRVVRTGTDAGVPGLDVALIREMPHDERASTDEAVRFGARVVATTDDDGTFHVEGASAGDRLRVSGVGWSAREEWLDAPLPGDLRIEIAPELDLLGRAAFADGHPCGFVAVIVHDEDPDAFGTQRPARGASGDAEGRFPVGADVTGSFSCGPLPAGRYWLEFRGGSPQVVRRVAGPFEAGTRDARVTLVLGETIHGRVLLPDGQPAKSIVVKASPGDRGGPAGEATSDRTGAFAIGGLDDEEYSISADATGCFTWTRSGIRAAADAVEIRLDEGLVVAGVVLGSDGGSFNFIDLVAEPLDADPPGVKRYGQTDVNGRFRITALTPGRWRIRFVSDSYSEGLHNAVVVAGDEVIDLRTSAHPPAKDDH